MLEFIPLFFPIKFWRVNFELAGLWLSACAVVLLPLSCWYLSFYPSLPTEAALLNFLKVSVGTGFCFLFGRQYWRCDTATAGKKCLTCHEATASQTQRLRKPCIHSSAISVLEPGLSQVTIWISWISPKSLRCRIPQLETSMVMQRTATLQRRKLSAGTIKNYKKNHQWL